MELPLLLKGSYSVMMTALLSMMWCYARRLTLGRASSLLGQTPLYGWIGFLAAAAIALHLLTAWQMPSVGWELKRARITPKREVAVTVKGHQFNLTDTSIRITQGEMVRFRVRSEDLTYGFGVFRENGRMEFQMQVVPGHDNDIIWAFSEPGRYSIRSTEYAGPQTWTMHAQDVIEVAPNVRAAGR